MDHDVTVSWYNDQKTLILLDYGENMQVEDMLYAIEQEHHMMDTVDHAVHVLIDYTRPEKLPPNILRSLPRIMKTSAAFNHENSGRTVIIGANKTFRNVIDNIVVRTFSNLTENMIMVDTRDEALARLVELGLLES